MQVRLLLGCAGSGKTFRCLTEARRALVAAPEGLPLLLLAPKQGTYQLEQQLLSSPELVGYTRLSIRSFESLARFILGALGQPCPPSLTEEGRVMVLRALLSDKRAQLKLFRASARLNGFAQQLSRVLTELQQAVLDSSALDRLASRLPQSEALSAKLQDLAYLLHEYLNWLKAHDLQDSDALLHCAAQSLRANTSNSIRVEALWVDGFAEFSEVELQLLTGLLPFCTRAVVTFCCDAVSSRTASWLSHWSVVTRNFERCRKRFAQLANVEVVTETLPPSGPDNRFSLNPILAHLERHWAEPRILRPPSKTATQLELLDERSGPCPKDVVPSGESGGAGHATRQNVMRLVSCVDREQEVVVAAREILAFVRAGGRYRDTSVLVRHFDPYGQLIRRVFSRYAIPFFLDRREAVAHHPLAELTRSALRVAAFGWQHEDWFAALKSGFTPVPAPDIDLLENEALARGWQGQIWTQTIRLRDAPRNASEGEYLRRLEQRLETIRRAVLPPFEKLSHDLAASQYRSTGRQLAALVRQLWQELKVADRLDAWTVEEQSNVGLDSGISVHQTVWRQMNSWLDNAELAFPGETLSLREWLPILDAGLANLTVGIIPPALDQVLIGAVDRSRTPEVELAVVLGLNESVFPALAEPGSLLTESDRAELAKLDVVLGSDARHQLARERYLGYIACTRARQRLVLTWATQDPKGTPLNPSVLLSRVRQMFPDIQVDIAPQALEWKDAQHVSELIPVLLRSGPGGSQPLEKSLLELPEFASLVQGLQHLQSAPELDTISPELAQRLYGSVLRTSVSRLEQFAACPFRFFVNSGLRAEERKRFELDSREQGTFQHEALAEFHQSLQAQGIRWRDLSPQQAREQIGKIARSRMVSFRDGLLDSNDQTRFTARVLTESLQDFVETAVSWMRGQYEFDPVQVELAFGEGSGPPGWRIPLDSKQTLELRGRIDRIDLFRPPGSDRALCLVLDYKSSHKQLERLLIENGLQLQLLSYLSVLRQWPNPTATFGVAGLEPVGVFYVNLRGKYERQPNRNHALAEPEQVRRLAYRHSGRFNRSLLRYLDSRPNAVQGDQFNYRLTRTGEVHRRCPEAVEKQAFEALLAQVEAHLQRMGREIYSGQAAVAPYRRGWVTACDQCGYQAICRIDPWTHQFRELKYPAPPLLPAAEEDPDE